MDEHADDMNERTAIDRDARGDRLREADRRDDRRTPAAAGLSLLSSDARTEQLVRRAVRASEIGWCLR